MCFTLVHKYLDVTGFFKGRKSDCFRSWVKGVQKRDQLILSRMIYKQYISTKTQVISCQGATICPILKKPLYWFWLGFKLFGNKNTYIHKFDVAFGINQLETKEKPLVNPKIIINL